MTVVVVFVAIADGRVVGPHKMHYRFMIATAVGIVINTDQ